MTKDDARQLGALMLAYANGKTIQAKHKNSTEWRDLWFEPSFNGDETLDYRVKPDQREYWIGLPHDSSRVVVFHHNPVDIGYQIIHVREVL